MRWFPEEVELFFKENFDKEECDILEKFGFHEMGGDELLKLKFNDLIEYGLPFAISIKLEEFISELNGGFLFNHFVILLIKDIILLFFSNFIYL